MKLSEITPIKLLNKTKIKTTLKNNKTIELVIKKIPNGKYFKKSFPK